MPELPEAETLRLGITPLIQGCRIATVRVLHPRGVRRQEVGEFQEGLRGRTILNSDRRGKAILLYLSGGRSLVFRLGMSGRLVVVAPGTFLEYGRVVLNLGRRKELILEDPRTFGEAYLLPGNHWSEMKEFLAMGPEPLADPFDGRILGVRFQGCRSPIGIALMDQHRVAGLGKIYADEALFQAGIHPLRASRFLAPPDWDRLARIIVRLLRAAIRSGGTTTLDGAYRQSNGEPGRFAGKLKVYQRTGRPCVACGTRVRRIAVQGNRGLHYCPRCQKR